MNKLLSTIFTNRKLYRFIHILDDSHIALQSILGAYRGGAVPPFWIDDAVASKNKTAK